VHGVAHLHLLGDMDILYTLLAIIALIIIRLLFGTPIIWIGEMVLFLVTLGRYKPQWNYLTRPTGVITGILKPNSNFSGIIGILSLCIIGLAIKCIYSFYATQ